MNRFLHIFRFRWPRRSPEPISNYYPGWTKALKPRIRVKAPSVRYTLKQWPEWTTPPPHVTAAITDLETGRKFYDVRDTTDNWILGTPTWRKIK